jgi:hypothetical protein
VDISVHGFWNLARRCNDAPCQEPCTPINQPEATILHWTDITRGGWGLILALSFTALSVIAGLLTGHAKPARYLSVPLAVLLATALAIPVSSALRSSLHALAAVSTTGTPALWASLAIFALLGFATGRALAGRKPATQHLRGTQIEEHRPRLHLRHDPKTLTLAGIPIPPLDETKHFKFIGTTGTGKSTAIRELLGRALARGDRAVIADPDAGYLNDFYRANRRDRPDSPDVILNPFVPRSHRWDLFAELEDPYDVDQLARALIPEGEGGSSREWRAYARTFFTAVTRQLFEHKRKTTAELFRILTAAPTEELKLLLAGTPAQPFLEGGNERMFGSIRSVTAHAIAALEPVSHQTAQPFSIRGWIRAARAGALFLPYDARQIATLGPMISAWMRLAIFETMSGAGRDQRLWFIVDELDALGAIDGLKDALARLRKFGGRCVLGFQSIAQVSSTYGQGEAQTIVENCGNTLLLRCSASESGGTARFASRLIGDREVARQHLSRSRRSGEWGSSTTSSEHRSTEVAVMPSEVEQLPDLQGFLKLASTPHWQRVKLPLP